MSNVFDKLMSASGSRNDESNQPNPAGGRPMHEHWYGYKRIVVNGKTVAKCMNCLKNFSNTGKTRLAAHR